MASSGQGGPPPAPAFQTALTLSTASHSPGRRQGLTRPHGRPQQTFSGWSLHIPVSLSASCPGGHAPLTPRPHMLCPPLETSPLPTLCSRLSLSSAPPPKSSPACAQRALHTSFHESPPLKRPAQCLSFHYTFSCERGASADESPQ